MAANQDPVNKKPVILVVDDEIANLRLLTEILTQEGYQVRSAEKPGLAIESALAYPPDLILLDVMMPEMDGFEVCQRFQEHETTREIPIIFVSALQEVDDKVRGFEAGGVDFISKPYQKSEVLARVKTHLQLRSMQLHLEELVVERTAELAQANESLRKSEQRFRATFEQAAVGIAHKAHDGQFLRLNQKFCDIVGYTHQEMQNLSFQDITHPDDLNTDLANVKQLLEEQVESYSMEKRYFHKNGKTVWVNLTVSLLREDTGEPGYFISVVEDITLRKKLEEERNRILNLSQDLICIAGLDGYFKYLNPAWEIKLGYTQEELLARPFLDFIHPDDHARNDAEVENLTAGHQTLDFENRYIHKNGSIRYISWTATPLPDENVMYCMGRDITERKLADQALNESEQKYRALVEQANDGIAVIQDEKIVFANKRFAEMTGRTFVGLLDTHFNEHLTAEELPNIVDLYRKRMDEETPSILETVIQRKDGSRVEVEFSADLTAYAGKPAVQVIVRDITDRKLAEESLKESEEKFRNLMEQSPVSIQIHSLEGRLMQSNAAYARLYALNEETLAGLYDKYNVLQDEQAKRLGVMPFIEKTFAGAEVVFPPYEYDGIDTLKTLDFNKPISRKCWVQTHGFPLKDKDGSVTKVVFMSEDITERKQAEQQILDYQERLKALTSQLTIAEERERRRIAAELHDHVSQSLAFARMRLASASKRSSDPKLLAILADISESLLAAIKDTKDLIFDLSSPLLNEIGLGAAISEWLELEVEKKHGLKTEFIDKGAKPVLDEDVRAILFRNVRELLTNVVRHAGAGKVSVRLQAADDKINLIVEDDGVGFDPDAALRATEREAGFGLFSIQERMNDMGGAFVIESEPGHGCKAILNMPLGS